MKPVHINREDVRTDTWRRLTQDLQLNLQALRELNDARMDDISTAEIRGQIKVVKELLALGKAPSANSSGEPEFPARQLAEIASDLGIDL